MVAGIPSVDCCLLSSNFVSPPTPQPKCKQKCNRCHWKVTKCSQVLKGLDQTSVRLPLAGNLLDKIADCVQLSLEMMKHPDSPSFSIFLAPSSQPYSNLPNPSFSNAGVNVVLTCGYPVPGPLTSDQRVEWLNSPRGVQGLQEHDKNKDGEIEKTKKKWTGARDCALW